jgi:hypothetical protein
MVALKSEGVCLYISDDTGSPSLRVLVGEVTDFTGPGGSAARRGPDFYESESRSI